MAAIAVPQIYKFSRMTVVGVAFALSLGTLSIANAPAASAAGSVVGDRVWHDINGNGLQDAEEPGVPGVEVWLHDEEGYGIDVTYTDENGMYAFNGVLPGEYSVSFTRLPSGAVFTMDHAGDDDSIDSDANTSNGRSPVFSVGANTQNLTIDAGIFFPPVHGLIGDHVWADLNGDGLQSSGEPGVQGVTVRLLDADGNLVNDTVTDKSGRYLFGGLDAGDYYVEVLLPTGWVFTTQYAGDDTRIDSNADEQTGRTDAVTISADADEDLSIDIGLGRGR